MELQRKPHLLLVENDINLGYMLVENLKAKDFDVTFVQDSSVALQELTRSSFDICIVDITLAEFQGCVLAEKAKEIYPNIPFIYLTSRSHEKDRIQQFEIGVDDYIIKPFSFKELHYRIMVILMRTNSVPLQSRSKMIALGTTTLLSSKRALLINGIEKKLSHRESELLSVLMNNSGEYVSRSEILMHVWGKDDHFAAKSMDVYINRVRKLLRDDVSLEIENQYGTGYRILQLSGSAVAAY